MWWIYVLVICLFVAVALVFFIYKKLSDKRNYKKLTKNLPETLQSQNEKSMADEKPEENLEDTLEETKQDDGFENFEFNEEEKAETNNEEHDFSINPFRARRMANYGREKVEQDRKYHSLGNANDSAENDGNEFDFDDNETTEPSEEDNASIEQKFAEYEKFLRENLDIEDDEFDDNFDDEFDDISNFDFNSLKGKSKAEIDEVIKNLSPRAKEILLSDILARKNFDDDDK